MRQSGKKENDLQKSDMTADDWGLFYISFIIADPFYHNTQRRTERIKPVPVKLLITYNTELAWTVLIVYSVYSK